MLKKGTRVKVMIPLREQTVSVTMKQLNGYTAEVEGCSYYRPHKTAPFYLYTLKDCPFFFIEDWLIPTEESEGSA